MLFYVKYIITWLDFCHIREFFWVGGGVNIFSPTPDDMHPNNRRKYDIEGCFLCYDKEYGSNKIALLAKMLYGAALASESFHDSVDFDTVHTLLKDFLEDLKANGLTPYQLHTRY